jgi:transcriptional regulator with XRE-family HTH domain
MPRKPRKDESLPGPSLAALGAAIRAVRVEYGLSVADAAGAAGCAPGRLASVEAGRTDPDYALLVHVARALGTTPSEFVRRAERESAEPGLPDALILAAIRRAEHHRGRSDRGVLYANVVDHLGLPMGSATGRRLRPRLHDLVADELVEQFRRRGRELLTLTPKGTRKLRAAGAVALSESPQHRRWREGRGAALERVSGFRSDVGAVLVEGAALLADESAPSDAWYALAERVEKACRRVGSATHCMREWPEPDDAKPEVASDEHRGRRNYRLWD